MNVRVALGAAMAGVLLAVGTQVDTVTHAVDRSAHHAFAVSAVGGAAVATSPAVRPPPPACFARPPIDQDLITPGMQAECSVVEVTDPDGPNRRENPLAACRAGGQRPCWQIIADPQCTQTAEHWRIDVDRAGVPGPAGGNLEVQCVVSIPVPPPV